MPDEERTVPLTALPYTLEPVAPEEVPAQYRPGWRTSRYAQILAAFLASGHPVALLKIDWPHRTTMGQIESFAGGILHHIKRRQVPVRVLRRAGEIYLLRTDVPELAVRLRRLEGEDA
jgi:hypothetical protein